MLKWNSLHSTQPATITFHTETWISHTHNRFFQWRSTKMLGTVNPQLFLQHHYTQVLILLLLLTPVFKVSNASYSYASTNYCSMVTDIQYCHINNMWLLAKSHDTPVENHHLRTHQAARTTRGPPMKHTGATTAPKIAVCAIQASCLAPKPSLYGILWTIMPLPIIAAMVPAKDWKQYVSVR